MNAAFYIFGSGMGFGILLTIFLGWSWIALAREHETRQMEAAKPELDEELKKLRAFHALHINKHD
jgi:hypothetical protein